MPTLLNTSSLLVTSCLLPLRQAVIFKKLRYEETLEQVVYKGRNKYLPIQQEVLVQTRLCWLGQATLQSCFFHLVDLKGKQKLSTPVNAIT
jgi:hypothetical protein